MEYRILPHGGEKIRVIGLGSGSITGTEKLFYENKAVLNITWRLTTATMSWT